MSRLPKRLQQGKDFRWQGRGYAQALQAQEWPNIVGWGSLERRPPKMCQVWGATPELSGMFRPIQDPTHPPTPTKKNKLFTDISVAVPNAPGQRVAKATISSNQTSLELLRVGMLAISLQLVLVETGGPVFPGPKRVTQLGGSTGGSTQLSEPTAK